jgi:hypothetical protein
VLSRIDATDNGTASQPDDLSIALASGLPDWDEPVGHSMRLRLDAAYRRMCHRVGRVIRVVLGESSQPIEPAAAVEEICQTLIALSAPDQSRQLLASQRATSKVQSALAAMDASGLLLLESPAPPWPSVLHDLERVLGRQARLVVSFGYDAWMVQVVPTAPHSFDARLWLPVSWAGLRGDRLQKACGIADAMFCHPNRFLAAFSSKASAMRAAELVIRSTLG